MYDERWYFYRATLEKVQGFPRSARSYRKKAAVKKTVIGFTTWVAGLDKANINPATQVLSTVCHMEAYLKIQAT